MLVNNAGIVGPHVAPDETTPADLEDTFATNVFAVVRVTQAFLPLLRESDAPVIVNVSSGMGSITVTCDPDRIESTIVNLDLLALQGGAEHAHLAVAQGAPRACASTPSTPATRRPTSTATAGPQTVTEGTDAIVAMAQIGPDGPTGTYGDRHGVVPW